MGRSAASGLLTTVLVIPITLGTVLTAEGLLNFLGQRGWLNRFLRTSSAARTAPAGPELLGRVFWSLIITGFPFAFLLILSYLSGIDPTLERRPRRSARTARQRFRRITLPLLAPGWPSRSA